MAGGTSPLILSLSLSEYGNASPLLNRGSEIRLMPFLWTISALKYRPPIIRVEIHLWDCLKKQCKLFQSEMKKKSSWRSINNLPCFTFASGRVWGKTFVVQHKENSFLLLFDKFNFFSLHHDNLTSWGYPWPRTPNVRTLAWLFTLYSVHFNPSWRCKNQVWAQCKEKDEKAKEYFKLTIQVGLKWRQFNKCKNFCQFYSKLLPILKINKLWKC